MSKRKKKEEMAERKAQRAWRGACTGIAERPEVTVKCVQLENNLNSRRFAILAPGTGDLDERGARA